MARSEAVWATGARQDRSTALATADHDETFIERSGRREEAKEVDVEFVDFVHSFTRIRLESSRSSFSFRLTGTGRTINYTIVHKD